MTCERKIEAPSLLAKFSPLRDAYANLLAAGRDPFAVQFDRVVSPTEAILRGRRTLLFGTNNYLGLTFDEGCIAKAAEALREQGTGTTGSRIANGSYRGHRELESALAAFFGRRHSMIFTTGYQANVGILSALGGKDDVILIDADAHASIYDGCRLSHAQVIRFRHNDADDLRKRMRRVSGHAGGTLIVVEGIYSMLGDVAPLREIAEVKREFGAALLVDEAHSLGVIGASGRGLAEHAGVEADVDFIVGTFSKSLGAIGGFCVSDVDGFEVVRLACRPYMFTASLPPSTVAGVLEALRRMQETSELRHRLNANAAKLHAGLAELGYEVGPMASPIVAVSLPSREVAVMLWNRLLDEGLYMNLALPPATPGSRNLLRTSVSAAHSADQIEMALAIFAACGRELGVIPNPAPARTKSGMARGTVKKARVPVAADP